MSKFISENRLVSLEPIFKIKQAVDKYKLNLKNFPNTEDREEKDYRYRRIRALMQEANINNGNYLGLMGKDPHHVIASLWPSITNFITYEINEEWHKNISLFCEKINNEVALYNQDSFINLKVKCEFGDIEEANPNKKIHLFDFDFNSQLAQDVTGRILKVVDQNAADTFCLSVWASVGLANNENDHLFNVNLIRTTLREKFKVVDFFKDDVCYQSTMPMRHHVWLAQK